MAARRRPLPGGACRRAPASDTGFRSFPGISVPGLDGYDQVQVPEIARLGGDYPQDRHAAALTAALTAP